MRIRKHGVAFPGTTATIRTCPLPLRKEPGHKLKRRTKGRPAALPGVGPRPEEQGRRSHPAAVAPTKKGLQGAVTEQELEPYLQLDAWPCACSGPVIKVGSDCSGLESVVAALCQMGLGKRVRVEFVCDKDPLCRDFLKSVHKPTRVYEDIMDRDVGSMPEVDLYSAGFPCQPWSLEGRGQGRRDSQGRGKLFDFVAEYINNKLPKCFLLENVAALTFQHHKAAFERMLETLRCSKKYFITWRVKNAMDFGIPQNRARVFIVGLLRSAMRSPGFPWPKPLRREPLPLTRFLCGGAGIVRGPPLVGTVGHAKLKIGIKAVREEQGDPRTMDISLDIWSGREHSHRMTNKVPCLTRSRCGNGGFFITSVHRLLTVEEMLNLQGLPISYRAKARRVGISDRQIGLMVGNAIATNAIKPILGRMLTAIGKHQ